MLSQESSRSSWAHRARANRATLVQALSPGHDGTAGDRTVQRGELFAQHLSREAFAQQKNKDMVRVWKCKVRVLTGTEYWRTSGNWA